MDIACMMAEKKPVRAYVDDQTVILDVYVVIELKDCCNRPRRFKWTSIMTRRSKSDILTPAGCAEGA